MSGVQVMCLCFLVSWIGIAIYAYRDSGEILLSVMQGFGCTIIGFVLAVAAILLVVGVFS